MEPTSISPALLKQNLFKSIEQFYKRETLRYIPEMEAILCCDDDIRTKLINVGDRIKKISEYKDIKHQDLYLTLLFTFYAMLGEQINYVFDTKFLKTYSKNPVLVEQLFIDLTARDLMEPDGTNLSSFVRRMLLGLNGGKRKRRVNRRKRKGRTRRLIKRQRRHKSKTKRTKY